MLQLFITILTSLLVISTVIPAHTELIDRVVAEVNEDVITLSEVIQESSGYMKKILQETRADEREITIRRLHDDILDSLIDKSLIRQEAARQGITVSEEEIEQAINDIIVSQQTTREEMFEKIIQSGTNIESYRANIKSSIYQNKVIARNVRSRIIITEDDILDFYDTHYTQHVGEGGYYLLQIGVSWDSQTDSSGSPEKTAEAKLAAEERVLRVHRLAKSGQDFGELAKKFSDLPSKTDGGDIGVFEEEDMASYMRDAVTTLQPGEISDIIETPVGYQFFKLLSSNEGGIVIQAPYDSVKDEIEEQLFQQEMIKGVAEWLEEIKKTAYIKKLL